MMMLTVNLVAAILVALALVRLPSAIRGRNVLISAAAIAIGAAFVLIAPAVYSAANRISPIENLVDLVSKLALFTGLLLAGTQVSRAWDAPKTQRRITGPLGTVVFLGLFLIDVVIFATVHSSGHAPDLADNLDNPLVRLYSTVATAYPAYIAALLLPSLRKGITSTQRVTRTTATLLLVGFSLAIFRFVLGLVTLAVPGVYPFGQIISGAAAVIVTLGMVAAFFARVRRARSTHAQSS